MPCAEAIQNNNLTYLLVQVMTAGKDYLVAVKNAPTPKYVGTNHGLYSCILEPSECVLILC